MPHLFNKIFTKKFVLIGVALAIAVLLCGYYIYFYKKVTLPIQTANGNVNYHVELALTRDQQRTGLMNRKILWPKTGMLFLFKSNRVAHMWMKDTLIPLDMVFFNVKGQVMRVHHNAIPQDLTIISSDFPVAGVLEINAGEAQKYGIAPGSKLDLKSIK